MSNPRSSRRVIGGAVLLVFVSIALLSRPPEKQKRSSQPDHRKKQGMIIPGKSIGSVNLGDPESKFHQLFPGNPKIEGTIHVNCGTELRGPDVGSHGGGILALGYAGVIAQIEAGTSTYATQDGITVDSTAEEVKARYPGLSAYELLGSNYEANGGRDLVFWVDWKRGIAFSFAYSRTEGQRYLCGIIVFPSNGKFCPDNEELTQEAWRELAPYSLEPPDRHVSLRSTRPHLTNSHRLGLVHVRKIRWWHEKT